VAASMGTNRFWTLTQDPSLALPISYTKSAGLNDINQVFETFDLCLPILTPYTAQHRLWLPGVRRFCLTGVGRQRLRSWELQLRRSHCYGS
jgi:hypothetical protein